jgi:hypothetical protein
MKTPSTNYHIHFLLPQKMAIGEWHKDVDTMDRKFVMAMQKIHAAKTGNMSSIRHLYVISFMQT